MTILHPSASMMNTILIGAAAASCVLACGGNEGGQAQDPSGAGGGQGEHDPHAEPPVWPQWAQNQRHTSTADVRGQDLNRELGNVVYDPLVPAEQAANGGALLAHYQAPLVDGPAVFMEFKGGTLSPTTYSSQTWSEKKLTWKNGELVEEWEFASDWTPPGSIDDFWEPIFHPVLANGHVYIPEAHGTIAKVDAEDGRLVASLNPFGDLDPNRFTVSPLSADADGNVYFAVIQLSGSDPFYATDAVDSWLVQVSPCDQIRKVSFSTLVPDAPAATDECLLVLPTTGAALPPSPDAVPPVGACGSQRVALNVAPAVAEDGTIYTVSRAHFNSTYGYLVAVNPDLTPKWQASLRDRFLDGCGVPAAVGGVLPPNGAPGGCLPGANYGVDPRTNRPGAGWVFDYSSASPAVAPDGSVFYGVYTRYNYGQGHLMHFSRRGSFLGAYPFGWDATPAIYAHDGAYSVVIKDNHYGEVGSYCNDEAVCPRDRNTNHPGSPERYSITQLNSDLDVEWAYDNVNTESCTKDEPEVTCNSSTDCAAGSTCNHGVCISCIADHPDSFEWCVNAVAVDADGVVYANSEDGWLYAIAQGGTLKRRIFQQLKLGAAYTPTSLGADGEIYSQNAGHIFVAGK